MVIHRINFPIYGILLIFSLIVGSIYIYRNLSKNNIEKKYIMYYFLMFIPFALIVGLMYTATISLIEGNGLQLGFSSYGGLIGVVIAAITFEFILPSNKQIIKYSVLSLPLVYGVSKLACTVAGCCYGIPYSGIFKVKYIDVFDEFVFPVQLLEVISNIILFLILNKHKDNKNIVYYTFISAALLKGLLDFLRYEHINKVITSNQIVSIIIIVVTIVMFIINKKKKIRR